MNTPTVAAPQTQPAQVVMPGVFALDKPVKLAPPMPTLASGNPLADQTSGALDKTVTRIVFGALLYRLDGTGNVDVYDGLSAWIAEAMFDPALATLKPIPYTFDKTAKAWTGTFVASALKDATSPAFATKLNTLSPQYGFLSILSYADGTGSYAVRSSKGTPFGFVSSATANRVTGGALQGLTQTQDASSADGLTMQVKDASGHLVGEIMLSSNTGVSPPIVMRIINGGVEIALVSLDWNGTATVKATTQAIVDAPTIVFRGELHAQKIRYRPANGSPETYL